MAFIKKISTLILSSLLVMGFQLSFHIAAPNSVSADPPPWAPAHGYRGKEQKKRAAYKYIYYPANQVYFSPTRGGYYYPYGGGWRFGTSLPSGIRLGNGISIELGGPRPYVYHPTVIQQYPIVIVP